MSGVGGRRADSLSIVIGAAAGERSASACLDALADQLDADVEVIVATGEPWCDTGDRPARTVEVADGLVPDLWAEGIAHASGDIVALLASTADPAGDWVERTRAAHRRGLTVVGGPIEAGDGLSIVDWGVYFCRYSGYMMPLAADATLEVPGDNASYVREVLRRYQERYANGFWEPFVHAALHADGHRFGFEPGRVVRHAAGGSGRRFARQRLAHGRSHGRHRSRGVPAARVLVGVASTPLVPVVMTARVARTVMSKHRHRRRFAIALPFVFWFYCCWACGELLGRLDALRGRA